MALAKQVYRHVPIGTDRNHNRYWVFYDATPGLYIEKGKYLYCVAVIKFHDRHLMSYSILFGITVLKVLLYLTRMGSKGSRLLCEGCVVGK